MQIYYFLITDKLDVGFLVFRVHGQYFGVIPFFIFGMEGLAKSVFSFMEHVDREYELFNGLDLFYFFNLLVDGWLELFSDWFEFFDSVGIIFLDEELVDFVQIAFVHDEVFIVLD